MTLRDEALNVVPPLQNTTGVKPMARFLVGPTCYPTLYRYLPTYFGGYSKGGYYTIKMDAPDDSTAKCYWTLAPTPGGLVDHRAVGHGTDIVWPMVDGDQVDFRVPPVDQKPVFATASTAATAMATMLQYNWIKTMSTATCYLTIRRSSLPEAGNGGVFKTPDGT